MKPEAYNAPTVDALRHYVVKNAHQSRAEKRKHRLQGVAVTLAACALALVIARAPVLDVEVSDQLVQEAAAMTEPCWQQLPMRVALTQANLDRLCINTPPVVKNPRQ